jgi:hypothetical protein
MAAAVSNPTYYAGSQRQDYGIGRLGKLPITGLGAGANTIPHNLPNTPTIVTYKATSAVVFHETQAADATNLYITVDSGAGTTIEADVIY